MYKVQYFALPSVFLISSRLLFKQIFCIIAFYILPGVPEKMSVYMLNYFFKMTFFVGHPVYIRVSLDINNKKMNIHLWDAQCITKTIEVVLSATIDEVLVLGVEPESSLNVVLEQLGSSRVVLVRQNQSNLSTLGLNKCNTQMKQPKLSCFKYNLKAWFCF